METEYQDISFSLVLPCLIQPIGEAIPTPFKNNNVFPGNNLLRKVRFDFLFLFAG